MFGHSSTSWAGHAPLFGMKRMCCWGGQAGEVAGVAAPYCCLLLEVPQPQAGPSGCPSGGKDGDSVCNSPALLWAITLPPGWAVSERTVPLSALRSCTHMSMVWLTSPACGIANIFPFPLFMQRKLILSCADLHIVEVLCEGACCLQGPNPTVSPAFSSVSSQHALAWLLTLPACRRGQTPGALVFGSGLPQWQCCSAVPSSPLPICCLCCIWDEYLMLFL